MPRESHVVNPMAPPTAIQPLEQRLQETVTGSTDQVMISSEETHTVHQGTPEPITSDTTFNAPDAAHSITEPYTLARRQRKAARSKRPPTSSTACFSFDTAVLMESKGTAHWKMIYKAEKAESVVQTLPSGNIMDLTDAHTTPIKTLCCFENQEGGNDMVSMGRCIITSHHHILMAEGWMTARQAATRG